MTTATPVPPDINVMSRTDRRVAPVTGYAEGNRQNRRPESLKGDRAGTPNRRTTKPPLPGPVPLRTRDAVCARLPTEGRAGPGWSGRIRPFARRAYRDCRHGNCRCRDCAGRLRHGPRRHGRRRGINHCCGGRRRRGRRGRGGRWSCDGGRGRCVGNDRRRGHLRECGSRGGLRGSWNDRAELAQSARAGAGSFRASRGDERQREERRGERPA